MRPFLTLHHPAAARRYYEQGTWRGETLYALLARHAPLRAGFRHEELKHPVQIVVPQALAPWRTIDLSSCISWYNHSFTMVFPLLPVIPITG